MLCCCQNETTVGELFYEDEYFDSVFTAEDSDWLAEQQAMIRLWITLVTRRVLLQEEDGASGRNSTSPIPGMLFSPSPRQKDSIASVSLSVRDVRYSGRHAGINTSDRLQQTARKVGTVTLMLK